MQNVAKNQREKYENLSNKLHKANSSRGDDVFKIKLVATEALNLIAEKISGKKITQLRSEGFDGFSKFLIISKHCLQFDKEVSKLLSKRTLA